MGQAQAHCGESKQKNRTLYSDGHALDCLFSYFVTMELLGDEFVSMHSFKTREDWVKLAVPTICTNLHKALH